MHPLLVIGCQCALALAVSFSVVAVWSEPLRRILREICGTDDRADFWVTYSNVMLVLIPSMLTLFVIDPTGSTVGFALVKQCLVPTMLGLFLSLLVIGVQISRFLPQTPELVQRILDRASAA